jgi:CBS domain-containing protein
LTENEKRLVRNSVDIAYFKEGESIFKVGDKPSHLYVIIKGYVRQQDGDEDVAIYGPEDTFDGRGLITGRISEQFIAVEEVIAYQLSKDAVSELIASNVSFGALLFSDLSKKLNALAQRHSEHEINSLSMARVDQAFLRPPYFLNSEDSILTAVKIFNEKRINNVLVRDESGPRLKLGIFTSTSLVRALLDGASLSELKIGDYSNYALITVKPTDHLYDALAVMLRHKIHRVVVMNQDYVEGILEQIDLLSYVSNSSSLIIQKISLADSLEQLKDVANEITQLIKILHGNGTKVSVIAKLVQELNAKLFERTWSLIAPAHLLASSCLFVMGSEGRGEQLLKTDQDNGLIIEDSFQDQVLLSQCASEFSKALSSFGYPECPGKIMVNNSDWRMSIADFKSRVKSWLLNPTPDSLMYLAIFLDSHPVSGNAELLKEVKDELFSYISDNQFHLMRFASAVELISSETGWWNKLLGMGEQNSNMINLKKSGIFAIVHGVRSLALENKVLATSTSDRISKLVELHKLDENLASEVLESLYFLMSLKLKAGLAEIDLNKEVSGNIDTSKLSSLDRDLLKEALNVVKRFKVYLRHHFRLNLA